MAKDTGGFPELDVLVGGYFHQDMDLEADSIPEAVANFAGAASASAKESLVAEMEDFLRLYDNNLDAEFSSRYGNDFTPDSIGQSVPQFFAMVREILADPGAYRRFETH